jgi:hypothetical protein
MKINDFDGNLVRTRIHEFGDKVEFSRTKNVMNIIKKIIGSQTAPVEKNVQTGIII